MTNDEQNLTPNSDSSSFGFEHNDDDLRYAPQMEEPAASDAEGPEAEVIDSADAAETHAETSPAAEEPSVEVDSDSLPVNVTDGLDIEAALAAVSTLSDVIAEQEAAEQARVARIEAEEQAKIERQARMENPERFFPVPPMTTIKRGQLAAIIPGLWLVGIGAWLTFTMATTKLAPDTNLVILIVAVGLGLSLLARWMASHRWASGSFFFGLLSLLFGGLYFYLSQPASPGLANGWPLFIAVLGLAMLLTRILSPSTQSRLVLPAVVLLIAGIAGTVITMGLLPTDLSVVAASLWPVAVVIIVLIWVFPLVFRQRQ
jgi:hypothetical protein